MGYRNIQTFAKSGREARRTAADVTANEKRVRSGEINFQSEKYADLTPDELADAVLHFLRTGELPVEDTGDDRFLPLSEAVKFFLAEHERRGTVAMTINGYRMALRRVEEWFPRVGYGAILVSPITKPILQKMVYDFYDEKIVRGKRKGEFLNLTTVNEWKARLHAVLKEAITHEMTDLTHADLHTLFDGLKFRRHGSKYDVLRNRDFQTLAERRATIKREGLDLDDRLCYQKLYLSEA